MLLSKSGEGDIIIGMGIYDGLKDAASILKEAGKIEQYRQILEVQEKLLEMQGKISELEVENKSLREQFETKGKLVPKDNMYYLNDASGQDGPFCTSCWDSDHKLIRLHVNRDFQSVKCPKCETHARPGRAIVVPGNY